MRWCNRIRLQWQCLEISHQVVYLGVLENILISRHRILALPDDLFRFFGCHFEEKTMKAWRREGRRWTGLGIMTGGTLFLVQLCALCCVAIRRVRFRRSVCLRLPLVEAV